MLCRSLIASFCAFTSTALMAHAASVSGADLVFQASANVPPREPRFNAFVLDTPTVRSLAQLYADFWRGEVHVAPALADRPLKTPQCHAPDRMVLVALQMTLKTDHLKILPLSTGVVAIREFGPADLPAARRTATPDELTRARAAMSTDRFWQILDGVRTTARRPMDVAANLPALLHRLSEAEILGFEIELQQRFAESYRWDLWAVASLVNGGCSADGFAYFRCWLVAQGRDYFDTALREPERAGDRASPGRDDHECEPLLYVADQAYRRKTGRDIPLVPDPGPLEPAGVRWDEDQVDAVYPDLARRFR